MVRAVPHMTKPDLEEFTPRDARGGPSKRTGRVVRELSAAGLLLVGAGLLLWTVFQVSTRAGTGLLGFLLLVTGLFLAADL